MPTDLAPGHTGPGPLAARRLNRWGLPRRGLDRCTSVSDSSWPEAAGAATGPGRPMSDPRPVAEPAQRSGTPGEVLRQWRALGLLGRDDVTTFEPADVQRARLIRLLLGRGVALDTLVQAERVQGFLERHLEFVAELVGPMCS